MKNKESQNKKFISNFDANNGPFFIKYSTSSTKLSKAMNDFMNVKNSEF